jgi:hypothetical protein
MEQTEIEALKRYGWSDDEIAAPPQNGFPQLIWPYYPDAPDLKGGCFSASQTEAISQPRSTIVAFTITPSSPPIQSWADHPLGRLTVPLSHGLNRDNDFGLRQRKAMSRPPGNNVTNF